MILHKGGRSKLAPDLSSDLQVHVVLFKVLPPIMYTHKFCFSLKKRSGFLTFCYRNVPHCNSTVELGVVAHSLIPALEMQKQ